MACAGNPDLRFITCNTTETGIVYDPRCRFGDHPPGTPLRKGRTALSNQDFRGQDLTEISGLTDAVAEDLNIISKDGAYALMKKLV